MKTSTSKSQKSVDWTAVIEVILKILTIGLYHVRKHQPTHETARE